ncbi:hypothetical protein NK718_16185 [Alsobacter sp. SYSU M60028]|uniref:Uncharacterized protein n=1 Tax=Alsobacter ponti TaxID=2962936 RepID=A0ABT1LF07_9HYPH|nr:hypothetical protein [Alsobacter ponti]MCP8940066.1 hypothetical protein [Alsobacter ponti]
MTYDPNDVNRRTVDEDYRSTGPAVTNTTVDSRPASNTGVIGAILGVLAVIAVIFFVWRGYDGSTTTNTSADANRSAVETTGSVQRPASPAGAPNTTSPSATAPAPAAPAPATTAPATTPPASPATPPKP